ncbi:phosphoketolase [Acidipila sp. EB88]|uniref:phosphoketolase family protein n=1 Tax=Acidipila sp. EB88 TaxID=2305226 RepID=UPI000F5F89BE|nr:phosphoketolase family protein [Acidipila sp. EB88]RRA49640.1 phosphoketolase family protein [Acidipila sp. EB88]
MSQLNPELLQKMHAYWRAANYLTVGQIYLQDNPLLDRPLIPADIKPRLLGHWGTTTGLNFIYTHLNRVICEHSVDMLFIMGPGHGGPGFVAQTYLEGTYTEVYPNIERSKDGMRRLFRQFSWPYGIPSHAAPETPGSIHEGGELGYSLLHAYGAAFDNPELVVACVVGDGEAETGPAATSWHSNKFLNAKTDGAVLPILHLNGFKIANPTVLARIPQEELLSLFVGYGYDPVVVAGDDPMEMHQKMADALDHAYGQIRAIQKAARDEGSAQQARPRWPMIILKTPKGWTGPKVVDGKQIEGTWRAHQVPLEGVRTNPEHLKLLEEWMKSYKPEELFDEHGQFQKHYADLAPKGNLRMGMSRHANGGLLLEPLEMPSFQEYGVAITEPGKTQAEATRVLGTYLRDVMKANLKNSNFRVFGPDETASNRLENIYEVSPKRWDAEYQGVDENLAVDGRVMEVLSEHMCEGWLEGYLLTGRHGFFSCYEAFIHIIDSMFNQHAKWLKVSRELPWRKPIASLNYLLSSHVWRQDHNGFSHQDPGFIDHVANKKAEVVRIYLAPDANCLLSVANHCLRSRNYVNLIIAGKQPAPVWLSMEDAVRHCTAGLGVWAWASNDGSTGPDGAGTPGAECDLVMACAGDVPTLETLAAVSILHDRYPKLRVRVVNVVDLFTLQHPSEHPHGIPDEDFDRLFTKDKPVIFNHHGYPALIHSLVNGRANERNFHVHGFREEGTTTSPFDMCVLNHIDRFTLVLDAVRRTPSLSEHFADAEQIHSEKMQQHKLYVSEYGEDMPEVRDWSWGDRPVSGGSQGSASEEQTGGDNA